MISTIFLHNTIAHLAFMNVLLILIAIIIIMALIIPVCVVLNTFGNGLSYQDIDECATGIHKCSVNANCYNNDGSYTCTCRTGYSGNGRSCQGIYQYISNIHVCFANADCIIIMTFIPAYVVMDTLEMDVDVKISTNAPCPINAILMLIVIILLDLTHVNVSKDIPVMEKHALMLTNVC